MIDPRDDAVLRELLETANVTVEQFYEVNAVSVQQKNYAVSLKVKATAQAWRAVKKDYQSPRMAKALIAAIGEQKEARFWIDHKLDWSFPYSAMPVFRADVKKNLEAL